VRLFDHNTVRQEYRVDVTRRAAGVVCERHRRPAEDVDISNHTSSLKTLAESGKEIPDASSVE
jgi:hypothetical protein